MSIPPPLPPKDTPTSIFSNPFNQSIDRHLPFKTSKEHLPSSSRSPGSPQSPNSSGPQPPGPPNSPSSRNLAFQSGPHLEKTTSQRNYENLPELPTYPNPRERTTSTTTSSTHTTNSSTGRVSHAQYARPASASSHVLLSANDHQTEITNRNIEQELDNRSGSPFPLLSITPYDQPGQENIFDTRVNTTIDQLHPRGIDLSSEFPTSPFTPLTPLTPFALADTRQPQLGRMSLGESSRLVNHPNDPHHDRLSLGEISHLVDFDVPSTTETDKHHRNLLSALASLPWAEPPISNEKEGNGSSSRLIAVPHISTSTLHREPVSPLSPVIEDDQNNQHNHPTRYVHPVLHNQNNQDPRHTTKETNTQPIYPFLSRDPALEGNKTSRNSMMSNKSVRSSVGSTKSVLSNLSQQVGRQLDNTLSPPVPVQGIRSTSPLSPPIQGGQLDNALSNQIQTPPQFQVSSSGNQVNPYTQNLSTNEVRPGTEGVDEERRLSAWSGMADISSIHDSSPLPTPLRQNLELPLSSPLPRNSILRSSHTPPLQIYSSNPSPNSIIHPPSPNRNHPSPNSVTHPTSPNHPNHPSHHHIPHSPNNPSQNEHSSETHGDFISLNSAMATRSSSSFAFLSRTVSLRSNSMKSHKSNKSNKSNKSSKSVKSTKSGKTSSKSKNGSGSGSGSGSGNGNGIGFGNGRKSSVKLIKRWEVSLAMVPEIRGDELKKREELMELKSLVGRAEVLERMLRAGKRVSNTSIRFASTSSPYSRPPSLQSLARALTRSSTTHTKRSSLARPSTSASSRSGTGLSLRQKLSRRLKRTESREDMFTELGSDEELPAVPQLPTNRSISQKFETIETINTQDDLGDSSNSNMNQLNTKQVGKDQHSGYMGLFRSMTSQKEDDGFRSIYGSKNKNKKMDKNQETQQTLKDVTIKGKGKGKGKNLQDDHSLPPPLPPKDLPGCMIIKPIRDPLEELKPTKIFLLSGPNSPTPLLSNFQDFNSIPQHQTTRSKLTNHHQSQSTSTNLDTDTDRIRRAGNDNRENRHDREETDNHPQYPWSDTEKLQYIPQSPHLGHRSPGWRNRQSILSYMTTGNWDEKKRKKWRIGLMVLSVIGVILIVGLLAGLLSKREVS
ncbi:hypothetical protein TREMEDRAFT_59908 [Tremella mesenterica DSM 1558]|uniref:uncharacterized protein n=1 Tax=Tremella mesenterica (strain ATCC 24925 / CBS 8224 / DSM 1558 / NBRC 9311 / NRRL Y-6157 / RJB 2259-6 / UBC 559-6) TaxID=578456 RepID=UPI0003F495CD|nr:uncharacterized protein TREMEDRAFT_59908 [Tremella mesenterica DSM 1558]EIW70973.1 hypothetical protein TREMEDRAFT_59908 [Tremella mesenterica DSM 1558]